MNSHTSHMNFFLFTMLDDLKFYLSLSSGIFSFAVFYKYYQYIKDIKNIEKEEKELSEISNSCYFFDAKFSKQCTSLHKIDKTPCNSSKCPFVKLQVMCDMIENAEDSLFICINLLTVPEIAEKIADGHLNKNVDVRVLCDSEMSTNNGSQIKYLQSLGIDVRITTISSNMHAKLAIIDKKFIMMGSLNWTLQGIRGNWDNLIITNHPNIVKDGLQSFDSIWNDSTTVSFESKRQID